MLQVAAGQAAPHQPIERLGIERLGDVVLRPFLHGPHRRVDGGVGGHDDDDRAGEGLPDPALQLETVHSRHLDVEEEQVPGAFGQARQRFPSARGRLDVVPLLLKPRPERLSDDVFIVDDQDVPGFGGRSAGSGDSGLRIALAQAGLPSLVLPVR